VRLLLTPIFTRLGRMNLSNGAERPTDGEGGWNTTCSTAVACDVVHRRPVSSFVATIERHPAA
jgi:hypothetical protein